MKVGRVVQKETSLRWYRIRNVKLNGLHHILLKLCTKLQEAIITPKYCLLGVHSIWHGQIFTGFHHHLWCDLFEYSSSHVQGQIHILWGLKLIQFFVPTLRKECKITNTKLSMKVNNLCRMRKEITKNYRFKKVNKTTNITKSRKITS